MRHTIVATLTEATAKVSAASSMAASQALEGRARDIFLVMLAEAIAKIAASSAVVAMGPAPQASATETADATQANTAKCSHPEKMRKPAPVSGAPGQWICGVPGCGYVGGRPEPKENEP
jgi:hypothetical protein